MIVFIGTFVVDARSDTQIAIHMADDSQLAEATQALSFAEFLERMKDPQAANLVRSIKKYVVYHLGLCLVGRASRTNHIPGTRKKFVASCRLMLAVLSRHLTRKLVIRRRTPKACR